MQRSFPIPFSAMRVNDAPRLLEINERLNLALQSSRQIAFDWHIDVDRLYFSGSINDGMNELLLDPSTPWHSSVLPSVIHRDDRDAFRARLHDALKGHGEEADGNYQVELRLKDAARGWRWVTIKGRVVERDSKGRALRMVGTFSDIDEQKREECRIRALRNFYAMLSQVNQAIVRIEDESLLFIDICRIAVQQGHFESASIMRVRRSTPSMAKITEYYGPHKCDDEDVVSNQSQKNAISSSRKSSSIHDDGKSHVHAESICAACFPIRSKGKLLGSLNLQASDATYFEPQLIGLLEEMARDISFAFEHQEREAKRKKVEALQSEQNRILNMVATGESLTAILMELAHFAEAQCEGSMCSIWRVTVESNALVEPVAVSLPSAYLSELGDIHIGANNGSCGTAAYRATPVIVTDIEGSPLWESMGAIPLRHGLKACVSWPIISRTRDVLGTLALYFRRNIASTDIDNQVLKICANLAGIAIESRASEEKMRYLAHYDGLTSLPNRFLFAEYLDIALRNAQRSRKKFAVLFLDLDKFKEINDTLGHDAGDVVLREMARRLRNCLRHSDKIARMGGDEFYVLLEDLSDGHDAAEVAQKLLDAAAHPVSVNGHDCNLSLSIGIGIYPDDGRNERELLENADKAMYRVKKRGKNGYQFSSLHNVSRNHDVTLMPSLQRNRKTQMRAA